MAQVLRATIANELMDELQAALYGSSEYWSGEEWALKQLQHKADKLQHANVAQGSRAKAHLAGLVGDWAEASRWIRNLHQNGASAEATQCQFVIALNLGYVDEAAAAFADLAALHTGAGESFAPAGLVCASFSEIVRKVEQLQTSKLSFHDSDMFALTKATAAAAALDQLGWSEGDVRAALNVAGEVLREDRLFWQDLLPTITISNREDDAGVLYEFALAVAPERIAKLNDVLIDKLIDRRLIRPGLAFAFTSKD